MDMEYFKRLGHGTRVRLPAGNEGTIENHGCATVVWDKPTELPADWPTTLEIIPFVYPVTEGEWGVYQGLQNATIQIKSVLTGELVATMSHHKPRDVVLGNARVIAKSKSWKELALRLAKHIRNTDGTNPLTWGTEGCKILEEMMKLDPIAWEEFVKSDKR